MKLIKTFLFVLLPLCVNAQDEQRVNIDKWSFKPCPDESVIQKAIFEADTYFHFIGIRYNESLGRKELVGDLELHMKNDTIYILIPEDPKEVYDIDSKDIPEIRLDPKVKTMSEVTYGMKVWADSYVHCRGKRYPADSEVLKAMGLKEGEEVTPGQLLTIWERL